MKLLGIDGLTKLIQLIKASFISVDDTVEVSTLELAEVATTGDYEDLINTPEEVVVDQTFDGTSENAQSGVAINGAGFLKNTAVGYGSLNILGNATNYSFSTTLGSSAYAPNNNTLAIGVNATAKSESSVALGSYNTKVGTSSNYSTAIGTEAQVSNSTPNSIQIGYGTNSTANSLSVGFYNSDSTHYNWLLLNGTTGLIPDERISSGIKSKFDLQPLFIKKTQTTGNGLLSLSNNGTRLTLGTGATMEGSYYGIQNSVSLATSSDVYVDTDLLDWDSTDTVGLIIGWGDYNSDKYLQYPIDMIRIVPYYALGRKEGCSFSPEWDLKSGKYAGGYIISGVETHNYAVILGICYLTLDSTGAINTISSIEKDFTVDDWDTEYTQSYLNIRDLLTTQLFGNKYAYATNDVAGIMSCGTGLTPNAYGQVSVDPSAITLPEPMYAWKYSSQSYVYTLSKFITEDTDLYNAQGQKITPTLQGNEYRIALSNATEGDDYTLYAYNYNDGTNDHYIFTKTTTLTSTTPLYTEYGTTNTDTNFTLVLVSGNYVIQYDSHTCTRVQSEDIYVDGTHYYTVVWDDGTDTHDATYTSAGDTTHNITLADMLERLHALESHGAYWGKE